MRMCRTSGGGLGRCDGCSSGGWNGGMVVGGGGGGVAVMA